jgi:hypothetical protein
MPPHSLRRRALAAAPRACSPTGCPAFRRRWTAATALEGSWRTRALARWKGCWLATATAGLVECQWATAMVSTWWGRDGAGWKVQRATMKHLFLSFMPPNSLRRRAFAAAPRACALTASASSRPSARSRPGVECGGTSGWRAGRTTFGFLADGTKARLLGGECGVGWEIGAAPWGASRGGGAGGVGGGGRGEGHGGRCGVRVCGWVCVLAAGPAAGADVPFPSLLSSSPAARATPTARGVEVCGPVLFGPVRGGWGCLLGGGWACGRGACSIPVRNVGPSGCFGGDARCGVLGRLWPAVGGAKSGACVPPRSGMRRPVGLGVWGGGEPSGGG